MTNAHAPGRRCPRVNFSLLLFLFLFTLEPAIAVVHYQGNTCSFVWNNTFYLWGPNQPITNEYNFTAISAPIDLRQIPQWISLPFVKNVSTSPAFPCTMTPAGVVLLSAKSTSLFAGYDMVSNSYLPTIATSNPPERKLYAHDNPRRISAHVYDTLYTFGLHNNLNERSRFFILNLTTMAWSSDMYQATSDYAPDVIDAGVTFADGKVYVVGGDTGGVYSDKVWMFDVVEKRWAHGATLPKPMASSVAVPLGNEALFVYGGLEQAGTPVQNILRLDLLTTSFVSMDSDSIDKPLARLSPSIGVFGDAFVVYGGRPVNAAQPATDMFIFNMTTSTWVLSVSVPLPLSNPAVIVGSTFPTSPISDPNSTPTTSASTTSASRSSQSTSEENPASLTAAELAVGAFGLLPVTAVIVWIYWTWRVKIQRERLVQVTQQLPKQQPRALDPPDMEQPQSSMNSRRIALISIHGPFSKPSTPIRTSFPYAAADDHIESPMLPDMSGSQLYLQAANQVRLSMKRSWFPVDDPPRICLSPATNSPRESLGSAEFSPDKSLRAENSPRESLGPAEFSPRNSLRR